MAHILGTLTADSIVSNDEPDIIDTGSGNDTILFSAYRPAYSIRDFLNFPLNMSDRIDGGAGNDTVTVAQHDVTFSGTYYPDLMIEKVDPILFGGYDTRLLLVDIARSSDSIIERTQALLRNIERIEGPDRTVHTADLPQLALLAKSAPIIESGVVMQSDGPSSGLVTLKDYTVVQALHNLDTGSDAYNTYTLRGMDDDGNVLWQSDAMGTEGPTSGGESYGSTVWQSARLTALADGGVAMVWMEKTEFAVSNQDDINTVYLKVFEADGTVRTQTTALRSGVYESSIYLRLEQLADGRLAIGGSARYDYMVTYANLDGEVTDTKILDLSKGSSDERNLIALESAQFVLFEDDYRVQWTDENVHSLSLIQLDDSAEEISTIALHEFDAGLDVSYSAAARLDEERMLVAAVTDDRAVHLVQYDHSTEAASYRELTLPYGGSQYNTEIAMVEDPSGGVWLTLELSPGHSADGAPHLGHAYTVHIDATGTLGDWFDATNYVDGNSSNHATPVSAPTATGILTTWGSSTTQTGRIAYSFAENYAGQAGTAAADILTGSAGNDSITGGAGADLVIQSPGADRQDGGDGVDTFLTDNAGATATLLEGYVAATDGSVIRDTLLNFENLRGGAGNDLLEGDISNNVLAGGAGADTVIGRGGQEMLFGDDFDPRAAVATEAAQVYRLYQAMLDRAPDTGGYGAWTARLYKGEQTLVQVIDGFVNSAEFQYTYGALDNQSFVSLLYRNVLGREADPSGLENWAARLDDGMTRAEVVRGFSESGEFKGVTRADSDAFAEIVTERVSWGETVVRAVAQVQAGWGDEVYRLYQATLARAPDANGFVNWSERLADGMALDTAAGAFVASAEFQANYGALDNQAFVSLLYLNVLGREADTTGLENWSARLEAEMSRAEVVVGFSQSREFIIGSELGLKIWVRGLTHGTDALAQDVLIAGPDKTLMLGGHFADEFRFSPQTEGSHEVVDLEPWDYISLQGFDYDSAADARADMRQSGEDVIFARDDTMVTFVNTALHEITDDMIWV